MADTNEHNWFGVPFSELTPVKRAEARFFIGGSRTVFTADQKAAVLAALKASGPIATEREYNVAVERHVAPLIFPVNDEIGGDGS